MISEKARSLYCRVPAGMNFIPLGDEDVLPIGSVPFELEQITMRWLHSLPDECISHNSPTGILRLHPEKGLSLTETGWEQFLSWMLSVLQKEQNLQEVSETRDRS